MEQTDKQITRINDLKMEKYTMNNISSAERELIFDKSLCKTGWTYE